MQASGVTSIIKSIQRGLYSVPSGGGTLTVGAVNTSKAHLNFLGFETAETTVNNSNTYLTLTNSTTITFLRMNGTANYVTISWELIEYN